MAVKVYKKWLVCLGAMIMLLCVTGLSISAFSVYLPYIRAENGFSNAQTTMLLMIRSLASLVTMAMVDGFYQRVNLKIGVAVPVAGIGLGFLLYGAAESYPIYCAAAALCGLSYGLVGATAAPLMIDAAFTDNKASALGIASAGTGLASIISPVIVVPLIEGTSLQTAFCFEGIFILACAVLVFFLAPNQRGTAESERKNVLFSRGKKRRFSLLRLSKGCTAALFVGVFLGGLVIYGITGFMSMLYRERFSGAEMSLLVSVFGFALMAGKVIYGRLVDRLGTYTANYFLFVALTIGLVGTCLSRSFVTAMVMAAFLGAGSPLANVAVPVSARDFANPGTTVRAVKYVSLVMSVAGLCISAVSGVLADALGSYVPVFLIMAIIAVISGALIQFIYAKNRVTGVCE